MVQKQLEQLIGRFTPEIAAQTREVLDRLRSRMPGAVEMVYDNYAGLVIGFGATDRASEAVLSVIVRQRHLTLCFLHGASLKDPHHVLQGEGKRVRHVRLHDPEVLDEPVMASLISQSIAMSPVRFGARERAVELRGVTARQLPRKPKTPSKK